GEKIAQESTISISWNKALVETVAIDFRRNSGAEWETIQTGLTGLNYEWTVPAVTTSEAMIRVRDESNNQVIAESQPFTIGAATINVLSPTAGTEWLVGTEQEIRWSSDFIDRVRI